MYKLDNTNGLHVVKDGARVISFPTYDELSDWVMDNINLLSAEEIDKFYDWQSQEHG
jgi:hypothetical protein